MMRPKNPKNKNKHESHIFLTSKSRLLDQLTFSDEKP